MAEHRTALAPQFDDLAQQHEASHLGMWAFLLTEVMFFGGLFVGYTVYRTVYLAGFVEGSQHLDVLLGLLNTAVLISSGLTMLLGLVFLGIKGYEYWEKYHHSLVPGVRFHYAGQHAAQVQLFLILYFVMTGLHALHMVIGLGMLAILAVMAWRGRFSSAYHTPVEMIGLYWHFVDSVWIFLYPLLHLLG